MVLSRCHPDVVGGTEWQARLLSRTLARRGHHVVLFALDPSNGRPRREEIDGFTVVRVPPISPRRPASRRRDRKPVLIWRYASAILGEAGGFDVLHAHLASLHAAGAAVASLTRGTPLVVSSPAPGPSGDLATLRDRAPLHGPLIARLVRRARRVIAMTDELAREARQYGYAEERIARIPNGVEIPDLLALGAVAGAPDLEPARAVPIVAVGRLDPQKRLDLLIEAVAALAPRFPGVRARLYGEGGQREALARLIEERSLSDRVALAGKEPRERVFRGARVFVLPSDEEGMSNALLEAMAYGVPCVVSDIPANRETAGDAAVYFRRGDSRDLAERIARVLDDPAGSEHLARRARDRAERTFRIEAVADRYESVYESLVTRRGPR
jgi:glycosyltransferase involved in cell wall biosynthesis